MKSLMLLWQWLAVELGERCSVSTTRDYVTFSRRVEHEGLSFLGITLPSFGKDFEKSLDQGVVAPDTFLSFKKRAGLPQFLGGFLELVFDRGTGAILDEPSIDAIQAIRQLTLLFGKLELPASDQRTANAMRGFVETEREVRRVDASRTASQEAEFRQAKTLLWSDVLSRVDKDLYEEQRQIPVSLREPGWPFVRPKHGPGATADRLRGNAKYDMAEWTWRLEEVFPSVEYLLPNLGFYPHLDRVDFREPGTERPVRVIAVPKTLKTPRIIAIEPSYMQYMQQGLKDILVREIRNDKFLGSVVGFDDQWANNLLAQRGSQYGNLATLDLSEASDRVSNQLVRLMVSDHPWFGKALDATRSRKADVLGFGVQRLAKFASMGSALTFPIEAMVFMTIIIIGMQRADRRRYTARDLSNLAGRVRVYGDDIIVPVEYAQSVAATLEDFGLKVNADKSFWTGKFRESCGKEYYAGYDVSVTRVRKVILKDGEVSLPSTRRHARDYPHIVAGFVNLRNRLYLAGYWRTCAKLDGWIRPLLGGYYPTVQARSLRSDEDPETRSQVLGRYSLLGYDVHGVDSNIQVPLVRGWIIRDRIPESPASEIGALMKVLTPREDPFEDELHLVRAGRPDAARSKLVLRWALPY